MKGVKEVKAIRLTGPALSLFTSFTLFTSFVTVIAQQAPVFRSSVDIVHLDVSVLDSKRVPVRGLTAKDFTVLEDGKPQPIVAFSAVDVPDPEPPAAPWMKTYSPDVQTNAGSQNAEGRLFVLLMDDAMLPPSPAFVKSAKDIAKKFLDRVTPADRVAVVFSAQGRNQNFTNDRARLVQAIDSMTTGQASHTLGWETARKLPPADTAPCSEDPYGPKFDVDSQYRRASMATLRGVAETLISAPQRRKSLIFVSPGIDIDSLGVARPIKQDLCVRAALREMNGDLLRDMPDLFLRMRRANVTIYPIDPGGLGGLDAFVAATAESIPLLRTQNEPPPADFDWFNPGATLPRPRDISLRVASISLEFLREAAENTGGLAVVGTNDFDAGLDRIFKENGSYYVIGYQEPPGSKPGSLHTLKVKVDRPGLEIRARDGYFTAAAPKGSKTATPISALDASIAGAVPTSAFPMRVVFAPFLVPGKKDPVVTIVLGLEQPAVTKRTTYAVELQTNAYTPDGRPRLVGRRDNAMVVIAPAGETSRAQYDLLSTISLPPGRYELRLSAHRPLDNVNGSIYADVEIPDFTKDALSVSGLILETIPAGATAPPGAFDSFLPVVPTSNREFRRSQDATAFMRIYQGGKDPAAPVTVTAKVIDRNATTVGEGTEVLAPDRFHVGGHAADYTFPIPLTKLPPGPYLVTFEISQGRHTVSRSVQFTVN